MNLQNFNSARNGAPNNNNNNNNKNYNNNNNFKDNSKRPAAYDPLRKSNVSGDDSADLNGFGNLRLTLREYSDQITRMRSSDTCESRLCHKLQKNLDPLEDDPLYYSPRKAPLSRNLSNMSIEKYANGPSSRIPANRSSNYSSLELSNQRLSDQIIGQLDPLKPAPAPQSAPPQYLAPTKSSQNAARTFPIGAPQVGITTPQVGPSSSIETSTDSPGSLSDSTTASTVSEVRDPDHQIQVLEMLPIEAPRIPQTISPGFIAYQLIGFTNEWADDLETVVAEDEENVNIDEITLQDGFDGFFDDNDNLRRF